MAEARFLIGIDAVKQSVVGTDSKGNQLTRNIFKGGRIFSVKFFKKKAATLKSMDDRAFFYGFSFGSFS